MCSARSLFYVVFLYFNIINKIVANTRDIFYSQRKTASNGTQNPGRKKNM